MARISIWIGEGCLLSTAATLMDALSIAELWHQAQNPGSPPLFETRMVTNDGKGITAYGNLRVDGDLALTDMVETDCLIISPVLPNITPIPPLGEHLNPLREKGTTLATVCTGAFVLAETGLLDSKRATTNWQYAGLFKRKYPRVDLRPEYMLTEDDNIICTGAATAVHNLAIYLIKKYGSQSLAALCAKALLVDPNRISQAPYAMSVPLRHHGDDQVLKAQTRIEEEYAVLESIDELARDVGISPRHFKRRFKKATGELPLKYLQRVRIEAAKHQLETTKTPIDKITWDVGYKDVSSFSRLFKQYTDISPRAYREKFYAQVPW